MKKLYFPVIFFLVMTLTSCLDVEERYDFKADGSSSVSYHFDMGQAVSVLMNLIPDSITNSPQFATAKDTTLNFYTALPDSTQLKLSAEETKMAQNSNLSIKMDLRKDIMKVSISHDAKNAAEMQSYLQSISKIATTNGNVKDLTKANGKTKSFDAQQLVAGQDYYLYEVTSNRFCRIIDMNKFKAFLKKTQATFAMAKAMLIETPYKVVLNFARPVKKVDNTKAIVSADRKQVILKTSMDEIIKNPSVMNLKIDF